MAPDDRIIRINQRTVQDATNQTVCGPTCTLEECYQIAMHGHIVEIEYNTDKIKNTEKEVLA